MNNKGQAELIIIPLVAFFGIAIILFGMWGCPQYQVYDQKLVGEAELARATYNRQVKVREAEAIKESAQLLADAEVIKASGIAKANKIVGDSLKGHDEYLKWLYIESLREHKSDQIIYIPTEAGLPILERRK